ncbi:hypothetical protein CANINC_003312 [Pichia inconspicua]|uniref:Chromosome segregation in meiosis protein n=1 Tax=Pichia inconspicua TaxID=52247 RepID=A0A4T0WZ10_9ASCO|nr:hypothetical protein CANINC_003312 [[Candida] inconspicua]
MSLPHDLSNDAILGLDVDLPLNENYNLSASNENFSVNDSQQGVVQIPKLKRKTDKLTPELLTSNQGVFKILKLAKQFKFEKKAKVHRNYDLNYKSINRVKFGEDHHYKNLTKVLQMYQSWGHELRSHMKFDRFIETVFKGFEDPYMKEWLRNQTREEIRAKMEKETLKEQQKIAQANSLAKEIDTSSGRMQLSINADVDQIQKEVYNDQGNDHEEEWSELFGGNTNNSTEIGEEDIDMSQIREKSYFSNYLRTSSQIPISSSQSELVSDTGKFEDNDEFDAIEGLQSIIEDEENDNVNGESQPNNFSQYIAIGSHKITTDILPTNEDKSYIDGTEIMINQSDTHESQEVYKDNADADSEHAGKNKKALDEDNFSDDEDIDALLLTL